MALGKNTKILRLETQRAGEGDTPSGEIQARNMPTNEKQSVFQPCSAELAARPGGESAWPWCANATPARSAYLSCFSFSLCAWVNLRGVPYIDFENQPLEWLPVYSLLRHVHAFALTWSRTR
jgi:hypothetical protein